LIVIPSTIVSTVKGAVVTTLRSIASLLSTWTFFPFFLGSNGYSSTDECIVVLLSIKMCNMCQRCFGRAKNCVDLPDVVPIFFSNDDGAKRW
jgi:hypothetical protein